MPPRLNQETLRKATVYIGEKNYYERQILRDMFLAQGLKQIICHATLDALRDMLFEVPPDLLVLAADFDPGVFELTEDPRPQGVRRIPVINTLFEKVSGREMDKTALKAAVEGSLQKVLQAQLDSQSFRLGEVCERLVTAYETGAIGEDVQADLMTLADVLKDAAAVAQRLKDAQLSSLCLTLADNVDQIADHYEYPTSKDIDLIRKITAAFKMAMNAPSAPDADKNQPETQPGALDLAQYQ
jgi:hypothetical protein